METKDIAMESQYYKCGICGKNHNDILSRAKCEIACTERLEEEAKKAAEAKKKEEYNARIDEVNMAFEKAYELRDKFIADYGEYKKYDNFDDVIRFLFGV